MSTETARPNLDVTVRAMLDGWPLDLHLSLPAEKVKPALDRLAALGYTPRQDTAPAGAAGAKPKRPRATEYNGDGSPVCPVHHEPMTEGRFGWFCPKRASEGQPANTKGYCSATSD